MATLALVGVACVTHAAERPERQQSVAAAGDYWIAAGDQGARKILAFDPAATDWNSSGAVKWSWQATTGHGFSGDEAAATGLIADFKLRDRPSGAQSFVVADGRGLAAVVDYPSGTRQWAKIISGNLHSAELLPDGNIALAASDGGWVRVYAASQGASAGSYAQFDLVQAHATLWDPAIRRLWVIGDDARTGAHILTALVVGGTAAKPTLEEDTARRATLPTAGGHDVYSYAHDANKLWVSTGSAAYLYDKTTKTFGTPAAANRAAVKSIGNQPSGQIVQTRPDSAKTPPGACTDDTWCTDTVEFHSPDATRTRTGAAFYKARVWTPYYSVVDRPLRGTLWDRTRGADGTWSASAAEVDDGATLGSASAAALPDGSLHAFTVVPGSGVWERTRSASGGWSSATQIDSNGSVSRVAAATTPDGVLHLASLVPGSGIWYKTRSTGGTWSSSTKIDGNGAISGLSMTALPNGTMQLADVVPDSGVWVKTRSAAGTWSSATKVDDDTAVTDVALAALPDGTVQLADVVPGGGIWARTRSAAGTWSAAGHIDTNGWITAVSLAALPDGTVQLADVVPGSGVWVKTRGTGGTWSSATKVDGNGSVLAVCTAGLPDGTLHLGTVPDLS
ncbi:DUF6528 family protein [Streptomyces odontomachi]|uniref:DUF6528 family protein n=1 Tax=Streptomyces odontomachi TaxID=2944940 RepID=UPI002108E761|nr:DUF6528 family protein [Streptomyces sp. ODS25]